MPKRNQKRQERRRSWQWHLDKRVILSILGGFLVQTATLVGTGLWWASHIETKQDEHSRTLMAHDAALRVMSTSQERIVRLETIAERLERVTARLEDRVNGSRR